MIIAFLLKVVCCSVDADAPCDSLIWQVLVQASKGRALKAPGLLPKYSVEQFRQK